MGPPVISLFSGGGGLDLGLESVGFSTRVCVEWERYACLTLRTNQEQQHLLPNGSRYLDGARVLERDIRGVSGAQVLREAKLQKGDAALLAGGPPCVTFSVAGKREGLTAATGGLFKEYVRILRATRPMGLIYENVKGLLSAVGSDGKFGGAFREIHDAIAAEGYSLSWRVVNAADYGVPQLRERVIILGRRGRVPPVFPEPTHADYERTLSIAGGKEPWVDVRSAIADLPPAAEPRSEPTIPNHVARLHGPEIIESFRRTPPGQRNPRFKRDRLLWNRPSKVIRAQGKPKPDGSGQKNSSHQALHPDEPRQLTPRECARIQTFPDWYWLPPQFVNSYRIVGDAVPPTLAATLGRAMLDQLGLTTPELAAA
jgi:DNA (cytosine-5)-methyltransferase 1